MKARHGASLIVLCGLLVAGMAAAQARGGSEPSERSGRWTFSLIPKFQFPEGIDFKGGSHLSTNEDLGLGFSFAFQPGEKLAIGLDFGWNSVDYDASIVSAGGGGGPVAGTVNNISGWFESGGTNFNATLNLMSRRATPYVSAGIGWAWVDTNIPTGQVSTGCWWDPWYGYICTPYQSTKTVDGIQYTAGAGIRYDVQRDFFIKVGYDAKWLDFDNADRTSAFDSIRLEFGSMF